MAIWLCASHSLFLLVRIVKRAAEDDLMLPPAKSLLMNPPILLRTLVAGQLESGFGEPKESYQYSFLQICVERHLGQN
jgi:hypothetical protein